MLAKELAKRGAGGAAGGAAGGGGGAPGGPGGVSNFAVLCAALKAFLAAEGGGLPPLAGVIPDMHADTDKFIALQQVYAAKAREDLATFSRHVAAASAAAGRAPADAIGDDEVARFVKNVGSLQLVRTRSLADELAAPELDASCMWDIDDAEQQLHAPLFWCALAMPSTAHATRGCPSAKPSMYLSFASSKYLSAFANSVWRLSRSLHASATSICRLPSDVSDCATRCAFSFSP